MKCYPMRNRKHLCIRAGFRPGRQMWQNVMFLSAFTLLFLASGTITAFGQKAGNDPSQPAQGVASHLLLDRTTGIRSAAQAKRPESGWLYVVDSNELKADSQILLVDPDEGAVVRRFDAGHFPDIALSPDGTRLYLASSSFTPEGIAQGRLDVINTNTGTILYTVDNPYRWVGTTSLQHSNMAISADGRWLYTFRHQQTSEGDVYSVSTFDTQLGRFLPDAALVPGCVSAVLMPLARERELNVVCSNTSDIRFLKISESGSAPVSSKLPLRYRAGARLGQHVGPVALLPDGRSFEVIMGDGRYFKVNGQSHTIKESDGIDSAARREANYTAMANNRNADDWLTGKWMRLQHAGVSPSGKKLYIGLSSLEDLRNGKQNFNQIVVLDGQTMGRIGAINSDRPLNSLALSKDGNRLYGFTTDGKLQVMDTNSSQVIRTVSGIGVTPSFGLVAP